MSRNFFKTQPAGTPCSKSLALLQVIAALGNKLRKTVVINGVTQYTMDYVGGIEYKNGILEAIYHSEGRVTTIDGSLKYEYAMKDHLGNTRLMFCDRNGDGVIKPENAPEPSEVTQENHYYAFGMNMAFGGWENTPSITDNLHQYNGKELNTDFGLNWNDYGARFYDPAIGRWSVVDSLAHHVKNLIQFVSLMTCKLYRCVFCRTPQKVLEIFFHYSSKIVYCTIRNSITANENVNKFLISKKILQFCVILLNIQTRLNDEF